MEVESKMGKCGNNTKLGDELDNEGIKGDKRRSLGIVNLDLKMSRSKVKVKVTLKLRLEFGKRGSGGVMSE